MIKRNWKAKTTTVATILLGTSLLMGGQAYAASDATYTHASQIGYFHNLIQFVNMDENNNKYDDNNNKYDDNNNKYDDNEYTYNQSVPANYSQQTENNSTVSAPAAYAAPSTANQAAAPATYAAPSTASQAASGNIADKIIADGLKYSGTPYKFGSSKNTTSTFDCSSFTQHVFKDVGITLPRDSRQQSQVGQQVSINNLQKGDLIFFHSYGSSSSRITHVAIYAGNNTLLHTYGKPGVTTTKFFGTSWEKRFATARRVI